MANFFKEFIYNLPMKPFLKNYILLESNPDFSDNSYYLFNELLNEKVNKDYKIIWFYNTDADYPAEKYENVKFFRRKNKLVYWYYSMFAKAIVDCNVYMYKKNKNQVRIHMSHGSPLKLVPNYCKGIGRHDFFTVSAKVFSDKVCEYYDYDEKLNAITGLPRIDAFFKSPRIVYFPEYKRKKTVFWFPTYRNHINGKSAKLSVFPFGIPCVQSKEELEKLNASLKKADVLLLIKNHPVECIDNFENTELSNIIFLNNNNPYSNAPFYDILNSCDALITDYSSIYFDYLITKKPIGLSISDFDEYSQKYGFAFDFMKEIPGEHLYTVDDVIQFVNNISNGVDNKYQERIKGIDRFFKYKDGNSSRRVIKLLLDALNDKYKKR